MSAPPVYDNEGYRATPLPAYHARTYSVSGSRGATEHEFPLNERKTKIRAMLKVISDAPTRESLPVILEGGSLVGSLVVHVPKSEKVTGVLILVRGELWLGGTHEPWTNGAAPRPDNFRFLDLSVPLWEKSQEGGGLLGDYNWPFSIPVPKEVVLEDPLSSGRKIKRNYNLPPTLQEQRGAVSIRYSIAARIVYKMMFLEGDTQVQATFIYVPVLRPEPPTEARQSAYQSRLPIPGPLLDPGGWHHCESVTIKGTVFNVRPVEIICLLSLALPLSYTRGGFIPCFLTYHCSDPQALDLIAAPSAISISLQRHVTCASIFTGNGHRSPPVNDTQECARAVFWPADPTQQYHNRRAFEGEIALPKTLKPTSAIAHFTLQYFAIIKPPRVIGFASAGATNQPLLRQDVQVGTVFPRGPRPISYSPI
uniref:Arrestin-like N-terminal domain-containing protein n=1 Tax=Mycena chlorophos TaxID=658473 RepID=A0ABQ0LJP0_MYCCL|nr:predicted protein [Mycena chlorophos]